MNRSTTGRDRSIGRGRPPIVFNHDVGNTGAVDADSLMQRKGRKGRNCGWRKLEFEI